VYAFLGYLSLLVAVALWSARRASSGLSAYFLAGRGLGRWVVALSAVVSGRSAWLLLGMTGMAYSRGLSAVWAVAGYTVVELFLFLYYAPRLRRFSGAYDCITVPDFYAARFGDERGRLRILLTAVVLVFMVGYVSAQFVAGGKAFASTFTMPPHSGILLTAAIVLLYTLVGGFLAVSLTDVVQAVLMLVALVALPILAVTRAGGVVEVVSTLSLQDTALLDPLAIGFGAMIGFVGIGLGSPGNPHILVRYMSVRDASLLRAAAVIGTVWNVLMAAGAVAVGLVARVYYTEVADPESVFPMLAQQHLHPLLAGVVMAAVLAAIMSTADSQLLVAASSVVRDVYEKVIHRGATLDPRLLVRYSRGVVLLLVLASLALGMVAEELVFWLVLFAWAGLGATLGPTSLLALFWRGTTLPGVAAGVAAGGVVTVAWYLTPALKAGMYELIPGFTAGMLTTVVVSWMTRPPPGVDALMESMEAPADQPG
jgi:sodium/proline symporter